MSDGESHGNENAQPITDPAPAVSQAQAAPQVTAVSIKIPPFWPSDPAVWIAQVESQFASRNISSQLTMFHHVVSALSPDVATEVRDILLAPPSDHPYDALKAALVSRTVDSAQRRIQQLLSVEELGDRKPSQVLRRMRQLLGDTHVHVDDSFLQQLFRARLPSNIRVVLTGNNTSLPLETQAELADRMMEASDTSVASISDVAAAPVSTTLSQPHFNKKLEKLEQQVAHLTELIHRLQPGSRSRPRSRSRSGRRVPTSEMSNTDSRLCWYHRRWGDKANKCVAPCSRSENA